MEGKCNCHWGGCTVAKVMKVLLVVGGLNWGLVGVGMLLGKNLNVVNMILGSMSALEAVVYLLVGVAAVSKLFGGCKCAKCKGSCADCTTCQVPGASQGM